MARNDLGQRSTRLSFSLGGLSLSILLLACSPDAGGHVDGGVMGDAGADARRGRIEVAPPAPPNIPWLDVGSPPIAPPMLTPCPEGWHEVAEEDPLGGTPVVICDPYGDEPGAEPDTCPDGWGHFLGDAGCTPVGTPCPAGDFPEGLPGGADVLFVLSSAPVGGDGSRGSPFSTINEAMDRAPRGTIIAVGKGSYPEPVLLGAGVTLWGACAEETRLTSAGSSPTTPGVITVTSADTHLKNLRIGPAAAPGLLVIGAAASVSVDGLIIEDAESVGLFVAAGASVQGRRVTVLDTRADRTGSFGVGIAAETSAQVDLTRVLVSRNRSVGVSAIDEGTSLTLSDIVVRDTRAQESDGGMGRGLHVAAGATATVVRAALLYNHDFGAYGSGEGTSLTLSDAVVRGAGMTASEGTVGPGFAVQRGATATLNRVLVSGVQLVGIGASGDGTSLTLADVIVDATREGEGGSDGWGLGAASGARVEATRARFTRNREIGVSAVGEGTSVVLSDVTIGDTKELAITRTGGRGLSVQSGAQVSVARGLLLQNRDLGVFASDLGTALTLLDVAVRNTQAQVGDGTSGRGINIQRGARADVGQVLVSQNRELGVFVAGEGTLAILSDLVVEDTEGRVVDGVAGRGLNVQLGATATVTRGRLSHNRTIGVFVAAPGTTVALTDVVVEDTLGQEVDGTAGRGLILQGGATGTVTRARFARNREFGIIAVGEDTVVELSDLVVEDTDEQACGRTTCAEGPFGVGLAASAGATLVSTQFELINSLLCGVLLMEDAEVDLSDGLVSGSQIGVCLQVDGYSIPRLTDRVRYADNGTNLDSTSLPLPTTVTIAR